ncbi:MAG TPA: 2,3,4,5-tetrahydropyridine-2,6-dicarboxylate N-succinyltransferase [Bacteroidota bacterium]|nr:2,3,4,5-tetrahydropyridine-2,6-dicarboxylate N-succinyltransferase [Bacteroidota bacterium]
MTLEERVERSFAEDPRSLNVARALRAFEELKAGLNDGTVRAAQPSDMSDGVRWVVNDWVKKGILLGFRTGKLTELSLGYGFRYFDKGTYPLKRFTKKSGVRIVPGGTTVRDGAFIARDVVIMPPAYVNVGAYVDEGSLIDSHALVGSCAQVGKRVHVSAGTQIGGVLEPVGAFPVIIEDDVFVGGNCGIYEGVIVKRRAVIAAGVILTGSTPVYDLPNKRVYRRTPNVPLTIPGGAVVVPGSRPVDGAFAKELGLTLYCPVIIKYRDSRTDAATALEGMLR